MMIPFFDKNIKEKFHAMTEIKIESLCIECPSNCTGLQTPPSKGDQIKVLIEEKNHLELDNGLSSASQGESKKCTSRLSDSIKLESSIVNSPSPINDEPQDSFRLKCPNNTPETTTGPSIDYLTPKVSILNRNELLRTALSDCSGIIPNSKNRKRESLPLFPALDPNVSQRMTQRRKIPLKERYSSQDTAFLMERNQFQCLPSLIDGNVRPALFLSSKTSIYGRDGKENCIAQNWRKRSNDNNKKYLLKPRSNHPDHNQEADNMLSTPDDLPTMPALF